MTKVIINIKPNIIYYECDNHAGDDVVCGMVSTLSNLAVITVLEHGYDKPKYEDGHVKMMIGYPSSEVSCVFHMIELTFKEIADRYPDNVRMY